MPAKKPRPTHSPKSLPAPDDVADARAREAEEQFTRGVITRGEAAKPVDGKLPPGATHELIEGKDGKPPTIQRKRFSMF